MSTVFPDSVSWKPKARSLDGQTGAHARLVAFALALGFDIETDDDDKELSYIGRPRWERFGHRVIGEIRGGDKAVVKITVKID